MVDFSLGGKMLWLVAASLLLAAQATDLASPFGLPVLEDRLPGGIRRVPALHVPAQSPHPLLGSNPQLPMAPSYDAGSTLPPDDSFLQLRSNLQIPSFAALPELAPSTSGIRNPTALQAAYAMQEQQQAQEEATRMQMLMMQQQQQQRQSQFQQQMGGARFAEYFGASRYENAGEEDVRPSDMQRHGHFRFNTGPSDVSNPPQGGGGGDVGGGGGDGGDDGLEESRTEAEQEATIVDRTNKLAKLNINPQKWEEGFKELLKAAETYKRHGFKNRGQYLVKVLQNAVAVANGTPRQKYMSLQLVLKLLRKACRLADTDKVLADVTAFHTTIDGIRKTLEVTPRDHVKAAAKDSLNCIKTPNSFTGGESLFKVLYGACKGSPVSSPVEGLDTVVKKNADLYAWLTGDKSILADSVTAEQATKYVTNHWRVFRDAVFGTNPSTHGGPWCICNDCNPGCPIVSKEDGNIRPISESEAEARGMKQEQLLNSLTRYDIPEASGQTPSLNAP